MWFIKDILLDISVKRLRNLNAELEDKSAEYFLKFGKLNFLKAAPCLIIYFGMKMMRGATTNRNQGNLWHHQGGGAMARFGSNRMNSNFSQPMSISHRSQSEDCLQVTHVSHVQFIIISPVFVDKEGHAWENLQLFFKCILICYVNCLWYWI